ncbi:hypothetical protein M378DRAFT_304073 [Amanita muscaria Koide BX008]|uniref:18S rRNA factor 2 n=1 Tax=Amanita muscaria (strain Koide BX008) TaxID=946122 RepID=A0A0C2TK51_AMAMK|nr:hypothetical protein M378DRAFT_304073 [Amanita muscaria Koide BX008]
MGNGDGPQEIPEAGISKLEEEITDEGSTTGNEEPDADYDVPEGMDPEGYSASSHKIVKPLTPEALAAYKAAQEGAGIIYISRIPPGMRPAKVRHLMSAYGEVGKVYLQQEDPKRAYLRRKYTSTKKAHFTEGWVEFKDKKIARCVADMLNAQSIGGKKGTRWRDDVWTMKYLPKFKWHMLTEQVAQEAAVHAAKLRIELSQSRSEQQEYLRNVEIARQLEKRVKKKREKGETMELRAVNNQKQTEGGEEGSRKRRKTRESDVGQLKDVLGQIF